MLEDRGSREGLLCITSEELRSVKRASSITEVYSVEDTVFARGKFATVRRASHKTTGVQYAAKYIKKRRRAIDMTPEIYHEICVLLNCASSSRVVRLHEVYETNADVVLVLELAAGGELQRIFDSDHCLTEVEARRAMRQILEGLSYLHEKNIAHLDLKPQNLLLTVEDCCDDIKLCDFGVSRLLEPGTEVRALLGTPDYVAPEVLSYEPISLSTDIWSAGVLAYVLLSGYTPFGAETKQQTYLNISQCLLTFEPDHFGDVSSAAIDFIKSALVVNPRKRPTVQELLQHHWISPKSHILPSLTLKSTSDVITTTPKTTPLSQHSDSSPEDSDISIEKDVDENVVFRLDTKYVSKMVHLFNNNCVNIIAATSIDIRVDENRIVTDSGLDIENKLDEATANTDVDMVAEHITDKIMNNNNENTEDEHKLFGHNSVDIENERIDEAPTVIEANIADQHTTDQELNYNGENTEEEKSHEIFDNNGVAIKNVRLDEALNTIDSLVDVNSVDEVLNNDLKHGNNTQEVLANNSISIENITSTEEAPTNIETNIIDEVVTVLHNNDKIIEDENNTQELLNTEHVVNTGKDVDESPTIIEADVVDEVLDNHNSEDTEDQIKIDDVLCNNDIANINKIDEAPKSIETDVVNQHTADKGLMDNDANSEDENKLPDEALNTNDISTVDVHTVNEVLDNVDDDTENVIKVDEVLGNNCNEVLGIDNVNRIDEAPTNIEADVDVQNSSNIRLMDKDANTEDENKLQDEALNTIDISTEDVHPVNEVLDNNGDDTEDEIKIDEVLGNNAIDAINGIDEAPSNIEADILKKPDDVVNNNDQNTNIENKTHVLRTNGIDVEKENRIDESQELIYV